MGVGFSSLQRLFKMERCRSKIGFFLLLLSLDRVVLVSRRVYIPRGPIDVMPKTYTKIVVVVVFIYSQTWSRKYVSPFSSSIAGYYSLSPFKYRVSRPPTKLGTWRKSERTLPRRQKNSPWRPRRPNNELRNGHSK